MRERFLRESEGFTLVELMLTTLLAGLIAAAIYSAHLTIQRMQTNQEQVVEMQQNLRAALNFMVRDIRMAGFDPSDSANAGFCTATQGRVRFTMDLDESGSTPTCVGPVAELNEDVTYGFSGAFDALADGIADSGAASLGRNVNGGGFQSIAENIVAVEFNYILDDETSTRTPAAADLERIVKIQVSLLARAGRSDSEFTNNQTYTTASGQTWGPYNDSFRRRLLITTIQCRNMGQ